MAIEWYRDNGVLKFRSTSSSKGSKPVTKGPSTGVSYLGSGYGAKATSGNQPKGTKPGGYKFSDYEVKRDNGVFRGWKKKDSANADAVKRAAERRTSSGPRTLYGAEAEWKKKHDFDDATARYKKDKASYDRKAKSGNMQDTVDVENYRKNRIARKDYKGKYYGPDVFKGDLEKLKAWRKAGSPKDVKSFAKSHPNTGR